MKIKVEFIESAYYLTVGTGIKIGIMFNEIDKGDHDLSLYYDQPRYALGQELGNKDPIIRVGGKDFWIAPYCYWDKLHEFGGYIFIIRLEDYKILYKLIVQKLFKKEPVTLEVT